MDAESLQVPVPAIVVAASACARDNDCACELCTEPAEEGGSGHAVSWRVIAALECSTNPWCRCEFCAETEDIAADRGFPADGAEEGSEPGLEFYIYDYRLHREMYVYDNHQIQSVEAERPFEEAGLRYYVYQYRTGKEYDIERQEQPMFDHDGEFVGFGSEL